MGENQHTNADPSEFTAMEDFRFNHNALREAVHFLRERDDRYKDMSVEDIAEHIGLSASTLKKLKRGEITDPRCSTLWLICCRLGLDPRILIGLAPDRDYSREAQTYNATLMEEMRSRMEIMAKQATVDDSRLVKLREMVLEKGEAMSRAQSQCAVLQARADQQAETIAQYECRMETKRHRIEQLTAEVGAHRATIEARDRTIGNLEKLNLRHRVLCKRLFAAACALALACMSIAALFAREMANLEEGITGAQLAAYLEAMNEDPEE